jgi:two-component sensor histidine kinase
VAGEGQWTKAQKSSIFHLNHYLIHGDPSFYQSFHDDLKVNKGDEAARITLSSSKPDKEIARQGFLQGMNHPNDVDDMIWLFVWFKDVSYMRDAIQIWASADVKINELEQLAHEIDVIVRAGEVTPSLVHAYMDSLHHLDHDLTRLETDFSNSITKAAHWIRSVMFWTISLSGIGFIVIGYRIVRTNVKRMNADNAELERALMENKLLLAEVHHRVKNNLAIITSLLMLQTDQADGEIADVLLKSQNRIKSIADVHELLYKTRDFGEIKLQDYLGGVVERIASFQDPSLSVTYHVDCGDSTIRMKEAVPMGILMNELVTNSYKHAFSGRSAGVIHIRIQENGDRLMCEYSDDGHGIPETVSLEESVSGSIGMQLILAVLSQLEAEYTYPEKETGFSIRFNIPNHKHK